MSDIKSFEEMLSEITSRNKKINSVNRRNESLTKRIKKSLKSKEAHEGRIKAKKTAIRNRREIMNRVHNASGFNQVMFKVITTDKKKGHTNRKGLNAAMRLSKYMSQNNQEVIEVASGEIFNDLDKMKEYLQDEWEPDFTTRRGGSDITHIVVSTPEGSSRPGTKQAARNFAQEYFKNFDYAFVAHEDTRYPHVHFMIKNVGHDGKILRLKKLDLEIAREKLAESCRAVGIQVAATRRSERGAEKRFIKKEKGVYRNMSAKDYYRENGKSSNEWIDSNVKSLKREELIYNKLAKINNREDISNKLKTFADKLKLARLKLRDIKPTIER